MQVKHRQGWRLIVGACLLGLSAQAQNGPIAVGAPLVGWMSEGTGVRPIQGVPGASVVGDLVGPPGGVSRVYVAPLQQWALVEMRGQGTLGRMPMTGSPGAVTPIDGAIAAPDLVSFSSNGKNAALVSRALGTLQIVTHLDGTPQTAAQSDISQLDVRAAAVSDDGASSVVLTQSGGVYLALPGVSPSLILQAGSPAGMAFLPNQASLAVADGAASTVTVLDGMDGRPYARAVTPGPSLTGDAAFLEASSDGSSLIFSAYGGQTAYRIGLVDQSVRPLAMPVSVSMLTRLSGDIYLVSANPGEAAWLLQGDGENLRIGFAQFAGKPDSRRSLPVRGARSDK